MWNKGEDNVLKFGAATALAVGQHTVWSKGGVYPWITVPAVAIVSSTSAGVDVGTHITVNGIDNVTKQEVEEEVVLDALGVATTTTVWYRIYRAWNSNSVQAVGTIEMAVSGTVVAEILPTANQTQMAVYTVPAGHYGYITRANYSTGSKDEVNFGVRTRENGRVFRLKDNLFGLTGNSVCRIFESGGRPQSGIYVGPLTDIEILIDVLTINARVSSTFALPVFKAR
jgi:hypothetical protein